MDVSAHKFAQSFDYATLNGCINVHSGDTGSLSCSVSVWSQARWASSSCWNTGAQCHCWYLDYSGHLQGGRKVAPAFKVCILPECSWAAASSLLSPPPAPLSHFLPSTSEPTICHSKWLLIPHKLISSLHGHAPEGLETFPPSLHSKLGLKTGLLDPTP